MFYISHLDLDLDMGTCHLDMGRSDKSRNQDDFITTTLKISRLLLQPAVTYQYKTIYIQIQNC